MKIEICTLIGLFLFSFTLRAESTSQVNLGEILISPTPTSNSVPRKESWNYLPGDRWEDEKLPSAIFIEETRLGNIDWDLQATSIKSSKGTNPSSPTNLMMRGALPQQTVILFHGIPFGGLTGNSVDVSSLEVLSADRVEIYPQFLPMELGIPSVGGGVNILHRPKKGLNRSYVGITQDIWGKSSVDILTNQSSDSVDYQIGFSGVNDLNRYPYKDNGGTPLNGNDDREKIRHGDSDRQELYRGQILKRVGNWTVQAGGIGLRRERTFPDQWNSKNDLANLSSSTNIINLEIFKSSSLESDFSSKGQFFYTEESSYYNDPLFKMNRTTSRSQFQSNGFGGKIWLEKESDFGLWQSRVSLLKNNYKRGVIDSNRQLFGLAQAFKKDLNNNYEIGFNIGATEFQDRANENWEDLVFDGSSYLKVNLKSVIVWTQIGSGSRFPEIQHIHSSTLANNEVDNLLPEKVSSIELGGKVFGNFSTFKNETSLVVFASQLNNPIVQNYDFAGASKSFNGGPMKRWGVEENFLVQNNLVGLENSYQYIDSKDREGNFQQGLYQHSFNIKLFLQRDSYQIYASSQYVKNGFYDSANLILMPNHQTFDAGMTWRSHQWQGALTAKNLTDARLEDMNGLVGQGRTYEINFKLFF